MSVFLKLNQYLLQHGAIAYIQLSGIVVAKQGHYSPIFGKESNTSTRSIGHVFFWNNFFSLQIFLKSLVYFRMWAISEYLSIRPKFPAIPGEKAFFAEREFPVALVWIQKLHRCAGIIFKKPDFKTTVFIIKEYLIQFCSVVYQSIGCQFSSFELSNITVSNKRICVGPALIYGFCTNTNKLCAILWH